jgi:hypothetical protein
MGAAVAFVLIWPVTDLIAAHDVGSVAAAQRQAQLQSAHEAVRTQLLTLGAGLFAAGALVFTARNSVFAQRTVQIAAEGQVTDRYTRAIEQLGSQELDVRIGGIYALERVARDSARDHPTIIEVLSAFIRVHSHEQWPPVGADGATPVQTTRPDVQAALTVIGRRNPERDLQPCDLTSANAPGANLTAACLSNAFLVHASLHTANLHSAKLRGAFLMDADISMAWLTDADLSGADLNNADLTGAILTGADLSGARWPAASDVPRGWSRDETSGKLHRVGSHALSESQGHGPEQARSSVAT